MKEKKPDINIDIKATVTDDGIEEKPANVFFRVPWGWVCIAFIVLFFLNVEFGKGILSPSVYGLTGDITVWGTVITFIFFIWKVMDKSDREGGYLGGDYPYLGM